MRRLLVVDDSALIREAARMGLEAEFDVVLAESGEQALELAASRPPDAILLDVMMPGMDGPATVAALRERASTAGIPIILVTAKAGGEDRSSFERLDVAGLIAKPFDLSLLAAEVGAILDEEAAGAQASPMDAIWTRQLPAILEGVDLIQQAVTEALTGALGEEQRAGAEREAHKLAGSVGTFGYMGASARAGELEIALRAPGGPPRQVALALIESLLVLRRELDHGELPGEVALDGLDQDSPQLLIVDDDAEFRDGLATEAGRHSLVVATAESPADARGILARRRPDVVLLGLDPSAEDTAALDLLAELGSQPAPIPVLVLTSSDAFTDRVEVARRGARGFLHRSLGPTELVAAAQQQLEYLQGDELRVLAVDDDPALLGAVQAILSEQGLSVTALAEPDQLWQTLAKVNPDLLILDIDMPGATGIDLCRAVRNDPRWAGLPIFFLTGRRSPDSVNSVFEAGADDYLNKPIVAAELTMRVQNRLERVRLYRAMADTDALTGIANRRRSSEMLELLVRSAERYGEPLSLAEIDIDHFKRVNDRLGHQVGDEVLRRLAQHLRRAFRGHDVVARWGGEEFVVGMYGMSRADGVQRVAELLEAFRSENFGTAADPVMMSFSAGVAQYPDDGADLQSLYRATDAALYSAKGSGRDRVLPAGWRPDQPADAVDVVVVEDDDALVEVLGHALETRGYSIRRFVDGAAALEALGGEAPELVARLVLLDVELPGLDGLSILRRLTLDGGLESTRVIMLTVHSGEEVVLEALELGAADHVAKPFSLPVLMQKVRRALA